MTKTIRNICIEIVQGYRRWISPLFRPCCRFYPTCSEYAIMCLQQDPLGRALYKIVKRIICCNPFHPGGVDLP